MEVAKYTVIVVILTSKILAASGRLSKDTETEEVYLLYILPFCQVTLFKFNLALCNESPTTYCCCCCCVYVMATLDLELFQAFQVGSFLRRKRSQFFLLLLVPSFKAMEVHRYLL